MAKPSYDTIQCSRILEDEDNQTGSFESIVVPIVFYRGFMRWKDDGEGFVLVERPASIYGDWDANGSPVE